MADQFQAPDPAHLRAALDLRRTHGAEATAILARQLTMARQFGDGAERERLTGIFRALHAIAAAEAPLRAA